MINETKQHVNQVKKYDTFSSYHQHHEPSNTNTRCFVHNAKLFVKVCEYKFATIIKLNAFNGYVKLSFDHWHKGFDDGWCFRFQSHEGIRGPKNPYALNQKQKQKHEN